MRLLFPEKTTINVVVTVVVIFIVSSASVNSVLATDSLGRVNFITKLPLALILFSSESHTANVWIPEAPPKDKDSDGSVKDEYAEVATVFAKPEAKVVQSEVLPSEQAVPWTSLKQEWELYKKFHENKNRRQGGSSEASSEEEEQEQDDEEVDEEEDEEDKEQKDSVNKLPQAFYGQQNSDDDEKDFLQQQKQVYSKKKEIKKNKKKVNDDSDEEAGDDDEEEADDIVPTPQNSDSEVAYSEIEGLEELSDSEKQAIIDKIFAGAAAAPQAFQPSSSPGVESSDEVVETPEDEEDEESSKVPTKKDGDESDVQDEEGGDGGGKKKDKKKKKKKKKGKKKGGGGWGWKKPIVVPIDPPKQEGWGWKHDGFLEQLVKGSTWERVLNYYHQKKDETDHTKGDGWGQEGGEKPSTGVSLHTTGEKLITKLFKGSFWDRAFQTYSQYKKNTPSKPAMEFNEPPLKIDW